MNAVQLVLDDGILIGQVDGGGDDAHEGGHSGARARCLHDVVHQPILTDRAPRQHQQEDRAEKSADHADVRPNPKFQKDIWIGCRYDRRHDDGRHHCLPGQLSTHEPLDGVNPEWRAGLR